MPLVFVHGVNVRYDPSADRTVESRNQFFRKFALAHVAKDATPLVLNPYWGDLAAKFPYKYGGLPDGKWEAFGVDDQSAFALLDDAAQAGLDPQDAKALPDNRVLLATARRSLATAVDALWGAATLDLTPREAESLVELAAHVAAYVDSNPSPAWLSKVKNDEEFAVRLAAEALKQAGGKGKKKKNETFGLDAAGDALRAAAGTIRQAVVKTRAAIAKAVGSAKSGVGARFDYMVLRVRTPMHLTGIRFLGDAFTYFRQREEDRAAIADRVASQIKEAARRRDASGEPLIVLGHSMGGNISYDLLTSTLKDLPVDVFVTVGSQVAVMEELRLFSASDENVPGAKRKKMPRPPKVARWINVFDTFDPFAFAVGRVFDDVEDYQFRTGKLWAHGGYFVEPMFHQRLGERLRAQ